MACLSVGLTACGDDGDSSSATSAAETSTDAGGDFVAEANDVCQAAYANINAAAESLDPADPSTVTGEFLPLIEDLQSQLEAIEAPEDVAADYEAVLAEQQEQIDTVAADPAAAFELDSTSINDQLDALGLTTCGSGSDDVMPSRAAGGSVA